MSTISVAPGEPVTLYATFKNKKGQLIAQPDPAIRIERINPANGQQEIVLDNTAMSELETGRYYYIWHTRQSTPLGTVLARYFGEIEGEAVEGEDVIQVGDRIEQRVVTNTAGIQS